MIDPKLDSQRPLVGPAPRPSEAEADEQAIAEAISGKFGAYGTHGSRAAGSAVRRLEGEDTLLMSADVLRATGDAIKNKTGSSRLGVFGELAVAFTSLKRGDLYRAAYHTGKAVEAIGKSASSSRLGAAANAVVLASSPQRVRDAHQQLKKDVEATLASDAPEEVKAKAMLDLSQSTWQLAYLYRVIGKAVVTVGEFTIKKLAASARFAAQGAKLQGATAKLAATSAGKAFAGFLKWVPLLNIVGVAVSAKNAVDVFHDDRSSKATMALATGSVVLAGAGLWAAIGLGFWPFLGLTAIGVGIDVALLAARKRDRAAAPPQIEVRAAAAPDRATEGP